jgi:sugar/nucleoside kinase (ribokinase family)
VLTQIHWAGPQIAPELLPRLEIEHHGGGRATLLAASWGAEAQLTPLTLPATMEQATFTQIAALSSATRQLEFLHTLREQRGHHPTPRLSVGTYARLVYDQPTEVRQLFEQADLFFMNENEANGLFGSVAQASIRPGALLFVTLGERGVLLLEGEKVTPISAQPSLEVDPTGAGDTFCGATLAGLAAGLSPHAAAEQAVSLAAQTVGAIGPAALLDEERRS